MTDVTKLSRREALAVGAGAASLAASSHDSAAQSPTVKLRLLETTDLHVYVLPYDYFRDANDDTVGLAKTAALIRAAIAEAPNTLLFDNGDFLQGSSLGDYIAYKKGLRRGDVHPMIAGMNRLPYAAGTLGNHEFNYGLDFLDAGLAPANFPVVCANVVKTDGTPLVRPWLILERDLRDGAGQTQRVKIGVIGFVPPQIMNWDKAHLQGRTEARDIVDAARAHLPALLAQNPDIVVALCHSGIAGGERRGGEENAALHLARLDGIDVVMTGHQHLVFPGHRAFDGIDGVDNRRGTLAGKPAVMAGFWGSHVGMIDLDLQRRDGRWRPADFKVETRAIFERTADRRIVSRADAVPDIVASVQADHDATLAYMRTPVAETTGPINSYFSLVMDDPSVQIVSNAQIWYTRQLVQGTPHANLPILSAAAPFKSGGRGGPSFYTDIKPGPIALKDVADIYLYPNTLQVVRVTGAQLREWLEMSAGIFNRIDPAKSEEQALIDPRFPAFNFDVIDGVTYKIDVTQPRRYSVEGGAPIDTNARRIVDLAHQGRPVTDTQEFLIASNNYRASGGGNFPGTRTTVVIESPDLNRDVIVRYLMEEKRVNPTADGNWSLAPLPRTVNVTFLTAPAAQRAVPPGLNVEFVGDGGDGFVKVRLRA